MTSGSFFIQGSEDALRHVTLLEKGLKKVAWAGLIGGAGCGLLALLMGQMFVTPQSSAVPGARELSSVSLVAWFLAIALLVFSTLYLIAGWGLSHQKPWARYTATVTFLAKVLLCVWLGRGSLGAMIVFLFVAGWDLYGLWVLLAKETGQLLSSPVTNQRVVKPANLVT